MYTDYWNLSDRPFSYRVSADALFRSRSLQAALLRMKYCFDNQAGACMLLGTSGVGKSSALRLISEENEELSPFVHIPFATLSSAELLNVVASEICGSTSDGTASPLPRIMNALRRHSDEGAHTVLALDEAHLLTQQALNDVVLPLLNLSENDHNRSFSLILCGQPVLGSIISRNAQLRERMAITATIEPFTAEEVGTYIRSRLTAVGAENHIFTDDAIEAIARLSEGNVRRVNRLCDMALLVGYADQKPEIVGNDVDCLSVELLPAAA